MSKLKKAFFKDVLQGVWSPFFRRRIKKELESHIEDLRLNENLSEEEALKSLGQSNEMNYLYKKLFYKKLRNDFYIFGSIFTVLLFMTTYYISGQVDGYIRWSQGEYKKIQKGYMGEMNKLHTFKRENEDKNAAKYISEALARVDRDVSIEVIAKLESYNYWEPLNLLPKRHKEDYPVFSGVRIRDIVKLVRASYKNMRKSKNKKAAKRQHLHLAKLIYSTETMAGFRIAQNMMTNSVYKENGRLNFYGDSQANRVSGMTWSLMNLQPSIVKLEEDTKDKNYYEIGLCHHAQTIWFQDRLYRDFLKNNWPLEKKRSDELIAFKKMKKKLKDDCRLSFLDYSKEPKAMSSIDIVAGSNDFFKGASGSGLNAYVPEGVVALLGNVPYFRSLAGRYVIWRTSINEYGVREYYKKSL